MSSRGGFGIGRWLGIQVRIDPSWLLILVLTIWNLAAVFGQTHPDWSSALRWGLAAVAALLFFGSVLLHELAHSLVARSRGLPVRDITLFLFGGVSDIQREPESPKTELLMAIVGPLTSLAIGVILTLIGSAAIGPLRAGAPNPLEVLGRLGPGATLVVWLGSVNIIVGLFNLIPGFPLDGGRVLRSILWTIMGDVKRATRWAAWVAQGISWLFIIGGASMAFGVTLPFFGTGLASGLWLAFIGWFLRNAAVESYSQLVVRDLLGGVPVQRLMRRNPPTVSRAISVSSLVHEHIMGNDDHAFPVVEDGRLAGLVTLEDVRRVPPDAWGATPVSEIMTPAAQLVVVGPEEDAADALTKLTQRDVGQLPVIGDGQLVGLLRRQDVVKWLQLHGEARGR